MVFPSSNPAHSLSNNSTFEVASDTDRASALVEELTALAPVPPRIPAEWEPEGALEIAWPLQDVNDRSTLGEDASSELEGFVAAILEHADPAATITLFVPSEIALRDARMRFPKAAFDLRFPTKRTGNFRAAFRPSSTLFTFDSATGRVNVHEIPHVSDSPTPWLEGDGAGTLFAPSDHPIRTAAWSAFREAVGISRIVPLPPRGERAARFAPGGITLALETRDPAGPDALTFEATKSACLAAGLPIVPLPADSYAANPLDYFVTSRAVFVPHFGKSTDVEALDVLKTVFADRTVLSLPSGALAAAGHSFRSLARSTPAARSDDAPTPARFRRQRWDLSTRALIDFPR